MRFERWLFGALGAAMIVSALLARQEMGAGPGPSSAAPDPGPPHAGPAPQARGWSLPAPAMPAVPVTPAEAPLREQLARLVATHDPGKALAAYRLLAECAQFIAAHDRLIVDPAAESKEPGQIPGFRGMTDSEKVRAEAFCGGMSDRERQARFDYLAVAVKAGVPGAAMAFAMEGPFGDPTALKTRPDDPLVREWKAAANAGLRRAADSGTDMDALAFLAIVSAGGSDVVDIDPALQYRYGLAMGLVFADKFGPDSTFAKTYARDSEPMTRLAAGLGTQQRAAELAAAQAIARRARDYRSKAAGAH